MFDNIAGEYDTLNRKISLGMDKKWRAKVVELVNEHQPQTILDIATGTGDLVMEFAEHTTAPRIVGLDISPGMLQVGIEKIKDAQLEDRIEMVIGDSEDLQFQDGVFDVVTVSYGVRNFENLEKGLAEILRVLKPGGKLVILETSVPTKFPFKQGYAIFSGVVVPVMGKLFSKDKSAYGYLSKSAAAFPHGTVFNNILRGVGFKEVKHLPQFFGASTIYTAFK